MKRRLAGIAQIEISSRCNLRCRYCLHPKLMQERKRDMDETAFFRALGWVRQFIERGTQGSELSLTGLGESTLHPQFVQYVIAARQAIGPRMKLIIATNGIALTDEICRSIASENPHLYVSAHRPEHATLAAHRACAAGIAVEINVGFIDKSLDWAGQVDWPVTAPRLTCPYLRDARACVLSDGRLITCCMDALPTRVIGTLDDDPASVYLEPFDLCGACSLKVPEERATWDVDIYARRAARV